MNGAPSDTGSGVSGKDSSGAGRAVVLIATVLLLACAGLVGYGLLDTEEEPRKPSTPTAAVTYEVTGDGTAEISFLGRNEDGRATVVRDAELPWKRTVRVPLGMAPTVAIVLGEKGGQASHARGPRQARPAGHRHGRVRAGHLCGRTARRRQLITTYTLHEGWA
ncbi:hypothetical protein LUX09_11875 [Streptomyces albogriseolus]|nr:hypothetical protein [Streptomyces albogriseolus]